MNAAAIDVINQHLKLGTHLSFLLSTSKDASQGLVSRFADMPQKKHPLHSPVFCIHAAIAKQEFPGCLRYTTGVQITDLLK